MPVTRGMSVEAERQAARQRLFGTGGYQPPNPAQHRPDRGNRWRPPCRGSCPGGPGHVHIRDVPAIAAHYNSRTLNVPVTTNSLNMTTLIKHFHCHKEMSEEAEEQAEETKGWKATRRAASQFQEQEVAKLEAEAMAHKASMSRIRRRIQDIAGSDLGHVAEFLIELAAEGAHGRYEEGAPRRTRGRPSGRDEDDEDDEIEACEVVQQPEAMGRKGKKSGAPRG